MHWRGNVGWTCSSFILPLREHKEETQGTDHEVKIFAGSMLFLLSHTLISIINTMSQIFLKWLYSDHGNVSTKSTYPPSFGIIKETTIFFLMNSLKIENVILAWHNIYYNVRLMPFEVIFAKWSFWSFAWYIGTLMWLQQHHPHDHFQYERSQASLISIYGEVLQ